MKDRLENLRSLTNLLTNKLSVSISIGKNYTTLTKNFDVLIHNCYTDDIPNLSLENYNSPYKVEFPTILGSLLP